MDAYYLAKGGKKGQQHTLTLYRIALPTFILHSFSNLSLKVYLFRQRLVLRCRLRWLEIFNKRFL